MVEFEVTNDGSLGVKRVTAGNTEKYIAHFDLALLKGETLVTVTATVTGLSTTSGVGMTVDRKAAVWYLNANAGDTDITLTLTVTTSDGQTLKYTVLYQVRL